MAKVDATTLALSAMQAAKRESARLQAEDAAAVAQRASQTVPAAPVDAPEHPGGRADKRPPLNERPSACQSCGKRTETYDGVQMYQERYRRVYTGQGAAREAYWGPSWKVCQRCEDVGLSNIIYADWLGIDQPFSSGALAELAREFPQVARDTLSGDGGKIWSIGGDLPPGPQRYDQEEGARAGDEGYPGPWMHPGAKRGRPVALARWVELQLLWNEDGRRHETLECCGVCGRSHAFRPVTNPPAGWRDNPHTVRWTPTRILGGQLACSTCARAYRQSATGGGTQAWSLFDWAAAMAAGVHPVPGAAAQIGQVLARNAAPVPAGDAREPWEHLGGAVLDRLRAQVARPARSRSDLSILDTIRGS